MVGKLTTNNSLIVTDKGGWTEWTVWSVCGENSVQERKRDCQTTFAIEGQCDGAQLERRMCSYNKIGTKSDLGEKTRFGHGICKRFHVDR